MPDERVHIQTFSNPALKDRFLQTIQQRLVRDLAKARPDKIRQEKTHHEERVQLPKFTSHTFTSGPQFSICMSDPRPSLLAQSGCTRRYFGN